MFRNNDALSFDDIWNSFIAVFRTMVRDNWMITMWNVQMGENKVNPNPRRLNFFNFFNLYILL
jgi:hypothetical protein